MDRFLELDPMKSLARGSSRQIFDHPGAPDVLIKVFHTKKRKRRWYKAWRYVNRRFGGLKTMYVEYEEYIAALARKGTLPKCIPLFLGFIETNLGVGMMLEKVSDPNGDLAPTLHKYVEKFGLSDELRNEVNELVDELLEYRIVCFDLTPRNIVVGMNSAGERSLMLVDGLSENTLIKLKTYSNTVFVKWMAKKRSELNAELRSIAAGTWSKRKVDTTELQT